LRDNSKARDAQFQALEICRMIGDRRFEIIVRIELGRLFDADGNRRAAIKNYLLAQSFARSQKDLRTEMDTWNLLGISYEAEGKSQLALDCYKHALALSREAESRYGESATLYQIAHTQFNLGDLAAARKQAEDAISLIESLRAKVSSQELRASYFASVRQLYELYIDVLMELHAKDPNGGYDVLAFEASERGRARSLLEMLASARVGVREKVDPELLSRERELRAQLSQKAEQSFAISSGRESERAQVDRELEELTNQYQEVRAQIRAASLEHTDQAQPRPLGLQQIRERDFADDTALLEFSLGERRSYGWFVTKDSFKSWSLPPRHEIEESAIAIRNLLIQPTALPGESFETTQKRAQQAEDEYWRKAAGFSKTLLGPVADDLGTNRLLIVPDGALQYIPFGALPIPSQANEIVPLIVQHEISLEPSASILATLRGRQTNTPPKALAVFADPVFELNDSRFTARPKDLIAEVPAREVQMERALRDANSWSSGRIPRLLASREEADAITSLTSVSDNLKAVGFDANKAAATSLDLSQYRIIHIATHGILDSRNPELSGLLLSRFDQEGRPREGFLRLDDIYNLSLSAAMVVLSACNTGLGKDVRGEGLVGLVHGFMYAGTSRVVASLWKVDDDATAELMTHFYREMFQSGKSPVAALRAAQIAMWQQKRWRAPYFWAAFVLHGDYEGRVDGGRKPRYISGWQVAGVVAFAMLASFFLWRRKFRKRHHAY
jgi:CHAT domain-containing protein